MWDEQFEEILRTFLPFLPPQEPLTADVELKDLGLDSLGMVQLLGMLEEAYQVRFRDSALTMGTFRSAGVLWETVEGTLQRAKS
ncbi:phosphopantetheine-binding protein [Streptomyces sp. NPDC058637]|uniref:phosphopantetheine-binding protein n=1 Tax=Streptomyces sp. NPDC058637 TaxID=3346569 RepID=UPI00364FBCD9